MKAETRDAIITELQPDLELWSAEATWEQLQDESYFPDGVPTVVSEAKEQPSTMAALGGCVWYLRRVLLDKELLPVAKFHKFDPSEIGSSCYLILDGHTLGNLEILENSAGGLAGTLLEFVDHCVTASGKRLIRQWPMKPLRQAKAINERLDIVEFFMKESELIIVFDSPLINSLQISQSLNLIIGVERVSLLIEYRKWDFEKGK